MSGKTSTDSRRTFLKQVTGIGLGTSVGTALRPALAAPRTDSVPIRVGSARQLFFDDFFVDRGSQLHASYPHNIGWSYGKVEKTPFEEISFENAPWEGDPVKGGAAWLTVLHDEGRYRMWYHMASSMVRPPRPGERPEGACVGYAESDDGLEWRKPKLGVMDRWGFKENNALFAGFPDANGIELGCVFRDPGAKPEERYKMIYAATESRQRLLEPHLPWSGDAGVLRGAYSGDGYHWTRYQEIFLGKYCDTQNVATYDPVLGKYVAYIRQIGHHNAGRDDGKLGIPENRWQRAVARIESDDYKTWTYPEIVLTTDIHDGLGVGFYNNGYSRYDGAANAHFLFPSVLHHRYGQWRPRVAVSRDNRTWLKPVREDFILPGDWGSPDDGGVSVAPGFLPAGENHVALYYRPYPLLKGTAIDDIAQLEKNAPSKHAHLGRVLLKRDRIVGIEAGEEEGTFWTRPLQFEGRRLLINAEPTGPDPYLRVQMLGVGIKPRSTGDRRSPDAAPTGFSFADNTPAMTDEPDGVVRWTGGTELSQWAGKPVRLHFRMKSMRIYAFQFVA